MTCEVRAFEPAHFEALNLSEVFHSKDEIRSRLAAILHRPGSFMKTLFIGDDPIAVVGMIQIWMGVAEVWTVSSNDTRKAPISYARNVKRLLESFAGSLKIHRVQMTVKRTNHEGQHLAAVLGFRNEGILREYGPDRSDHLMFARVF